MEMIVNFIQSLIIVPLTLLPIINPLSTAPVFMATAGESPWVAQRLAWQVAFNGWIVLVASMLVGTYVLELFGISLPIVRIGGGLLVAATGWRMLNTQAEDEVTTAVARQPAALSDEDIVRRSFFPLTFPLTTGPGTIAASIALGAKLPQTPALYLLGAFVAILGATLTMGVIYFTYRNAGALLRRLGPMGTVVMMRLVAFILLCIGIEIIWTGWAELNKLPL